MGDPSWDVLLAGARRTPDGYRLADGRAFTPFNADLIIKARERPGYTPYCLVCDTMARMRPMLWGWECIACRNRIDKCGFHLFLGHYEADWCALCDATPVAAVLDGEALCLKHANEWSRGEGAHAMYCEEMERGG